MILIRRRAAVTGNYLRVFWAQLYSATVFRAIFARTHNGQKTITDFRPDCLDGPITTSTPLVLFRHGLAKDGHRLEGTGL